MKQSNMKQHIKKASNMSFGQMVSGTSRLVGNTISLGFKALGAGIYIGNKALDAGLQVGKAAYNETKKGYHQTDDKVDQLLSSSKEEQPQRSYPVGSDAVRRPQQMEFDFDQSEVK